MMLVSRRKIAILPPPLATFPLAGVFGAFTVFLLMTSKFTWVERLETSAPPETRSIDRIQTFAHADAIVRLDLKPDSVQIWYGCSRAMAIRRARLDSFLRDLRRERTKNTAIEIHADHGGVSHGEVIAAADTALRAGFVGVFIEPRPKDCGDPQQRRWLD